MPAIEKHVKRKQTNRANNPGNKRRGYLPFIHREQQRNEYCREMLKFAPWLRDNRKDDKSIGVTTKAP